MQPQLSCAAVGRKGATAMSHTDTGRIALNRRPSVGPSLVTPFLLLLDASAYFETNKAYYFNSFDIPYIP